MKISGQTVVDATKRILLHITPVDVKRGDTKDPGGCAAARALMREIPNCTAARVHLGRTYVRQGNRWVRYQTPHSLRSEVVAFDRGGQFEPGYYPLRPVCPTKKATGKAQGSSHNKKKNPNAKRRTYHTITGMRPHGANR